jgi:hypothetical protein
MTAYAVMAVWLREEKEKDFSPFHGLVSGWIKTRVIAKVETVARQTWCAQKNPFWRDPRSFLWPLAKVQSVVSLLV